MDWFTTRVLEWAQTHGRKNLPWQTLNTPYGFWIAEVMLQQTQVKTVLPYFKKLVAKYPDVTALSQASEEQILADWHGLGYYRRALNLRRSAILIVEKFNGEIPNSLKELQALPGLGRSSAGSIASSAWDLSAPILDGNVKRVLCRFHGVGGPEGTEISQSELWKLAESHTPKTQCGEYTQAIMDFGSKQCKRTQPECSNCPLSQRCRALQLNQVAIFPQPNNKPKTKEIQKQFLVLFDTNFACLLEQQGSDGVFAHMWDTPEISKNQLVTDRMSRLNLTETQFELMDLIEIAPYRISNFVISEKVSVAKCDTHALFHQAPDNMKWVRISEISEIGMSVKTRQRINRAKTSVERL